MGLTRKQEKCVFPISACKLDGRFALLRTRRSRWHLSGIEFPVPVEVYAAVVFNVQRASGFHQYIGILDGAAVHLRAFRLRVHKSGIRRASARSCPTDFESCRAYDDIVGERATSPFGG